MQTSSKPTTIHNPPLFASVSSCSATRQSVAFALFTDTLAEVPLSPITASPGTSGMTGTPCAIILSPDNLSSRSPSQGQVTEAWSSMLDSIQILDCVGSISHSAPQHTPQVLILHWKTWMRMLSKETWKQNLDIDWKCRKQQGWIAFYTV